MHWTVWEKVKSFCSRADNCSEGHPPTLLPKRRTFCHMVSLSFPPLSAPPGQENHPDFSLLSESEIPTMAVPSRQSARFPLGCMESRTLAPCWTAFPCSAGLSSLDRDGASRLAGFKEEESCMPNLPTVGRQGNKNQGLWDEITKEKD